MLFFTRSFICIGAVLALIEAPTLAKTNAASPDRLAGSVAASAAGRLGDLCWRSPRLCMDVGSKLPGAGLAIGRTSPSGTILQQRSAAKTAVTQHVDPAPKRQIGATGI